MANVAVIGETVRVAGFRLAGAVVLPADTHDAARAAWASLGDDVAVVILTPEAAEAVGERAGERTTVVMPP
ncbi:V-type ATP synthase subunit F [Nonomuraea angiospora]|uniref:Vacuolar-type H+-ATPase subunit F/Vma7 n=1 Tax=Nonomuraea angiospora TaxID=46172 RepID=A0ABR9M7Q3_9ACTN|nr:V-type ATP synthase subunit F [Nonomuraea angiospora]MBE1588922.1 vacuolar-type H+-ATPase subunit F/Vma7 [Nonomuraea angiospora]